MAQGAMPYRPHSFFMLYFTPKAQTIGLYYTMPSALIASIEGT